MKIAFFTDMILRQTHGVAVAIVDIANGLAKRGHMVYLFGPELRNRPEFLHPNVILRHCASVPTFFNDDVRFGLPFDLFVADFIRREKIEIIHLHTPGMLGLQAIAIAKLLHLPLVGTYHSFFAHPEYLEQIRLNNRLVEKLAWVMSNFYYNSCDLVICPSEGTKAELVAHNCKNEIRVIPHGIDASAFDNSRSRLVKKEFNRNGKLLLSVGRVSYGKNIIHLIECCALAFKGVPSLKLVLVGNGPLMQDVKRKIKDLNISDKVILTGAIRHEELVKSGIFGACDIFVTASRVETGPLVVLEAQANGMVCVMVKGKGMALVKDGINGYVVDSEDKEAFAGAIVSLVKDRKRYAKMKDATLREIKKYELPRIISQWENTYNKLKNSHLHR